jgi:hypothetical protein
MFALKPGKFELIPDRVCFTHYPRKSIAYTIVACSLSNV